MFQIQPEHLQKIQDFGFIIDQRQHDHSEGILELSMFVQLVEDHVGIGITADLDDDPHPFSVGFIPQIRDPVHSFVLHQFRDLLYKPGLVDQIRDLRDNDTALSAGKALDIRHGPDPDLSAACPVSLLDASLSHDGGSRRKVGTLYDLHDLFDGCVSVFIDLIINDLHHSGDDLPQIVRRDVGGHADGDAGGSVDQKIGVTRWKYCGFLLCLVKVGNKIHGIFADIRQQFHGDSAQPCLCISHGRSSVSVYGAEITVSVNQRITGGPLLSHIYQCSVDGTVSMGMVFTHGIAYDTGALSVRLVGTIVQLDHGIKNSSLNRLETVSYIGKSPGSDHAHGVIDVGFLHGLFQIDVMNLIKYIRFHSFLRF